MSHRALASLLLIGASLCACSHTAPVRHNPMAQWAPSPNADTRQANLIVLHGTEQDSVEQSLLTLRTRNSGGRVSAHYLIGRDGELYQMVAENDRAWHAGAGSWGGITRLNAASIGIELDNNGSEPFPPAQIDALLRLLDDICARLRIPRSQIIGHGDMAPTRKRDPSRFFPWQQLADAGFGLWPDTGTRDPPSGFDPWLALRAIGYPLQDREATVRAYRRHYRGDEAAQLDVEDLRILYALSRKLVGE